MNDDGTTDNDNSRVDSNVCVQLPAYDALRRMPPADDDLPEADC